MKSSPDNTEYFIYGLSSSEDGEMIRYIGMTKRKLSYRLQEHSREYRKKGIHHKRSCWIKSIIQNGYALVIAPIDNCIGLVNANKLEQHYIKLFKSVGAKLVNGTDGGDGTFGHVVSDKVKMAVSTATKNRIVSEETRKKQSIAKMGHAVSPETREKLRVRYTGKKYTQEQKDRLNKTRRERGVRSWALGTKGVINHSIETRNKISQTLKRRNKKAA